MKKNKYMYLFAAALGLGLSACSSDDLAIEEPGTQQAGGAGSEGEGIAFSSRIAEDLEILDGGEGDMATRSGITDGQFAYWSKGDKVAISDGMLSYTYQVKETTEGTACSFEVVEGGNEFTGRAEGTKFYAFYPATAITGAAGGRGGWNGSVVSAMIFAEQDNAENLNDGDFGAYMASEETTLTNGNAFFNFHLTASVIDVDLSGLGFTPKSVSIKSNSGVSLAGLLKYDCAARTASVSTEDETTYAASTQSDVVTVGNITGTTVRCYVLPVVLEGGVTITVWTTDDTFYTKTATGDVGTETGDMSIEGLGNVDACKPYYKKYNFGAASTAKRLNNWMATIPSNTKFNLLSIPGAHDAATWKLTSTSGVTGVVHQYSRTQTYSLDEQLAKGVRAFDLRPAYMLDDEPQKIDDIPLYHGLCPCDVTFKEAMETLISYAQANSTEGIFVLMNGENSKGQAALVLSGFPSNSTDYTAKWRTLIRGYLQDLSEAGSIVTSAFTSEMSLKDIRGKVLVVTRKPYGDGGSFSPCYGGFAGTWVNNTWSWPENDSFTGNIYGEGGTSVISPLYVQDYYQYTDVVAKAEKIEEGMEESASDVSPKWYFNFVNMCGSFSLTGNAYPKKYAGNVNESVVDYLVGSSNPGGRLGVMFMDFCGDSDYSGDALNNAIIGQNFKYVYKDRSRNPDHMPDKTGALVDGNEYADDSDVYSIGWR